MKDLIVPGKHIRTNALNAALVMKLMGVESKKISEILGRWNGIEHRLEFFHESEICGQKFRFYNDSAASQSFDRPVIFLTGGTDKGLDLSPLSDTLASSSSIKPEAIYMLSGSATDKLLPLFEKNGTKIRGVFDSIDSMLEKLKEDAPSFEKSDLPKIVVLSPGATSFGMFKNEFDRGNQFKEKVRRIFGK